MSTYFEGLISDGVYENIGDRFLVTSANDGMKVNVGSGRAVVQSHWVKNDATTVLTLDPSDVQLNRTDYIVLRLDREARTVELTVKHGNTSYGEPFNLPPTRNATVWELYLASVRVNKGATQPTFIIDLRPSSYCGWVTGLIKQVDTTDLFAQWNAAYQAQYAAFDSYIAAKQAAFEEWFAALTGELKVEAGITKLQSVVTVSAGSNSAAVMIDEYDMELDVLFVFVEGVFFTEGVDYELVKMPHYAYPIVQLLNGKEFTRTTKITFIVLKNIIGKDVALISGAVTQTSGVTSTAVGNAEVKEDET
jgi:hypothetical protein